MKIVRTILLVLLLVALAVFSYYNWLPVEVRIWEGLVWETKIPVLVIIPFLAGLVPMWLAHLAAKWRMKRRIAALENAARTAAVPVEPLPPVPVAEPEPASDPAELREPLNP
ncbi:LapA family protein [Altericroceibacterium xinjiangense]|uniref:LapA family protein n=1 Tax=Altericroceibacterium xinjiangense TaxID=762261 RepID=UPI000F7EBC0E|nr:LapA family protein [Altericroceibacterium xinjiangense]